MYDHEATLQFNLNRAHLALADAAGYLLKAGDSLVGTDPTLALDLYRAAGRAQDAAGPEALACNTSVAATGEEKRNWLATAATALYRRIVANGGKEGR